jgi:hypothetical protein
MIVVRANLYSGHAEKARRKRPKLWLGMTAAVLLSALFLADLLQSQEISQLRAKQAESERQAGELSRELEAATVRDLELQQRVQTRNAVLNFAAQRRNWAPVLARAFAAIPPTVTLSGLEVEARETQAPRVRFSGKCAGAEPRLEADKCMLQITHALASAGAPMTGRFVMLEDAASELIGADNRPRTAEFIIQFTGEGVARAD